MRSAPGLSVYVIVVLWATGGCARPAATTVAPTQDELPKLVETERILPISVAVEGRHEEPRVLLVPEFKEPELTPEERAALGEEPEPINWWEFYRPFRPGRVSRDFGGVSANVHGVGGAAAGLTGFRPLTIMGPGLGGVATGAHNERLARYGTGPAGARPGGQGPVSGVRVGEGPPSRISAHQTRPEP